jgi:hypothetical protein
MNDTEENCLAIKFFGGTAPVLSQLFDTLWVSIIVFGGWHKIN